MVAGLQWHPLGLATAAGMAVLLTGAVATHRRAGDAVKETTPVLLALAVTAAYLAVALAT